MKLPHNRLSIIIAISGVLLTAAITAQPAFSQGKGKGTVTQSEVDKLKDARDKAKTKSEDNQPDDPTTQIAEDTYVHAIVTYLEARDRAAKLKKDKADKDEVEDAEMEADDAKDIAETCRPKKPHRDTAYRKLLIALRLAQRALDLALEMTIVDDLIGQNDPVDLDLDEKKTHFSVGFFGGQSVAAQSARNAATTAVRAARPGHVPRCRY